LPASGLARRAAAARDLSSSKGDPSCSAGGAFLEKGSEPGGGAQKRGAGRAMGAGQKPAKNPRASMRAGVRAGARGPISGWRLYGGQYSASGTPLSKMELHGDAGRPARSRLFLAAPASRPGSRGRSARARSRPGQSVIFPSVPTAILWTPKHQPTNRKINKVYLALGRKSPAPHGRPKVAGRRSARISAAFQRLAATAGSGQLFGYPRRDFSVAFCAGMTSKSGVRSITLGGRS